MIQLFLSSNPYHQELNETGSRVVMYAKDLPFATMVPKWKESLKGILPEYLQVGDTQYDMIGYLPESSKPRVSLAYVDIRNYI